MLVIDPVCEAQFEEEEAFATVELNGEVFHFCSETCLRTFREEPERYAGEAVSSWGDEEPTAWP